MLMFHIFSFFQLKPRKRRTKLWHFSLPEELIFHVLASRRRQQAAGDDDSSEDLEDSTGLLNLVLRAAERDVLSDEDEESSEDSGDCSLNLSMAQPWKHC